MYPVAAVSALTGVAVFILSESVLHLSDAWPPLPAVCGVVAAAVSFVGILLAKAHWQTFRQRVLPMTLMLMLGLIVGFPAGWRLKPEPVTGVWLDPPTDLDFKDWHVGDVHVHAAGDFDLTKHEDCRDENESGSGRFLPPSQCAEDLVRTSLQVASRNGVEWLIFVEHGPWLGKEEFASPYDGEEAREQWQMVKSAADRLAQEYGVRALMGEELGTLGPTTPGHFSAYYIPDYVENRPKDTHDIDYVADVARVGGWGAVNHPFSGGSTWDCWYPRSRRWCQRGIVGFAGRVGDGVEEVGFRALEITNGGDFPKAETLRQWDELLVQGFKVWPVGGSDGHTRSRSAARSLVHLFVRGLPGLNNLGISRTFILIDQGVLPGTDFDSTARDDPVRTALFSGHTVASNGPLAIASLSGEGALEGTDPGGTLTLPGPGEHVLALSVRWPRDFSGSDRGPDEVRIIFSRIQGGCQECVPPVAQTFVPQKGQTMYETPLLMPQDWETAYVRVEVVGSVRDRPVGSFIAPFFVRRQGS